MPFHRLATRSEKSGNWRADADPVLLNSSEDASIGILHDGPTLSNSPKSLSIPASGSTVNLGANPPHNETVRGGDDPRTLQAIAERRRLYVGNLPYMAKTQDVMDFFGHDYQVEHINMSTDPYTGRNPSYCFVELKTKAQADKAMHELDGQDVLGRPVKVGPGVTSSNRRTPRQERRPAPVFDRWTRTDAPDHFKEYNKHSRRLWVGGLPRMGDHHTVNDEVRSLFEGYKMYYSRDKEAVSKVVVPIKPAFGKSGAWNHRYLFVDFSTAEEADAAAKATNGTQAWGVKIRVLPAKGTGSRKLDEREAWREELH